MARYIDVDKFREYAFYADTEADIAHYTKTHGYVAVIPKSEYERLAKELERVEALYFSKDAQVKQLRVDLDAMRGAANSYKMHYENLARKICCEIEEEIVAALESNYRALKAWDDGRCNDYILEMVNRIKGKIDALRGIEGFIEELKDKYTEEAYGTQQND